MTSSSHFVDHKGNNFEQAMYPPSFIVRTFNALEVTNSDSNPTPPLMVRNSLPQQKSPALLELIFNPLSPIINMHHLLTVLQTFLMAQVGRICLYIKTVWWYCKEKLDTDHCWGLKG